MTGKVELQSASFVFTQDADGNESCDQSITVTVEECGGGHYFTIETGRWSFDVTEMAAMLADVRKRLDGLWRDDE